MEGGDKNVDEECRMLALLAWGLASAAEPTADEQLLATCWIVLVHALNVGCLELAIQKGV